MKTITIIAWLTASMLANADEKIAVRSVSGRFEVTQEHRGDIVETVRFLSPVFPSVVLPGLSWPGLYHISPDEHWLLRTQKTGSGDNMAILYRIEDNGRVSEVLGFDDMLWKASDVASRLKKEAALPYRSPRSHMAGEQRFIADYFEWKQRRKEWRRY